MEDTNEDGITFDRWTDRADHACVKLSGLGLSDLPDGPSYDAWADGVPPAEYARMILAEEGFPFADEDEDRDPNPVGRFHTGTERRVHTNDRIDQAIRARKVTGSLPILY